MPTTPRSLADRFWEKVEKTETCWIWRGAVGDGYGRIRVGGRSGRMFKAHRVSWFLHYGVWPKEDLLHSCQPVQPLCVRVDHLREGDDAENHLDMMTQTTAERCRHGVLRTPENTYIRANGTRRCRCRQQQLRKSGRATWRDPDVAARPVKSADHA